MEKYDEALLDTYLNSDKLVPKVRAIQSAIQSSGVATMDHITSLESLLPGVVTDHYSVKKLKTMTEDERAECTLEALNLWGGLILGGGIALLFATIMHFFFGDSFGSGGGGGGGGGSSSLTPEEKLPESVDTGWITEFSTLEKELGIEGLVEKLRQKKGMGDTFGSETTAALKRTLGQRLKVPDAVANEATRSGDSLIRFITDVEKGLFFYRVLQQLTDKGRIKLLVGAKDPAILTVEDLIKASGAILKHQQELNDAMEKAIVISKEALVSITAGKTVTNTDIAAQAGFVYTSNSPLVAGLREATHAGKTDDEHKLIHTLKNEIVAALQPCDVDYTRFHNTAALDQSLKHVTTLAKNTAEFIKWYHRRSKEMLGEIAALSKQYEGANKVINQHAEAAMLTAQIHSIKTHFESMEKTITGLFKIMVEIQKVPRTLNIKLKRPDSKHLRTHFHGDVDILTKIVASATK